MISAEVAIQYMRDELKRLKARPEYRIKSESSIRCPFCGDSQKSEKDEHLYIKMKPDERDGKAYFPYSCKLCPARRKIFSPQDIKTFGITNTELITYITHNYNNKGNVITKTGYNYITKKLKHTVITSNVKQKQDYLYARLGNRDICEHPGKYKIVLDLVSFFKENKLEPNFDYPNVKQMLRNLHENAIGFLSFDNTHINFRDITGKIGKRYTQYQIYSEKLFAQKNIMAETSGFYTVSGMIDSLTPSLSLYMAEGSFDILRVYFDYCKHSSPKNTIFASVSNANGYTTCISKFLEYGIMFENIHVYSDDDVVLQNYINTVRPIVPDEKTSFTVHYNTKYKDFGDIREQLEEVIHVI